MHLYEIKFGKCLDETDSGTYFSLISSYLARDIDSDEDDMEAGANAVLQEEQRSSLYGRREDEREERLLDELKRQKMQKSKP